MKQDIRKYDLANGMRLVTVPVAGVSSLTVLAMVGVGSRFEEPKLAGISHFLEHLPFKGTANYPTALEVSTAIDGVGGAHNAFTGKEYTGYWVKVASNQWRLAMDMVSDLLLTARLREEDIEREKGVIVEEINMYEDNPQAKVSSVFDELVFAGSTLATDVAGRKETVTALTREDFVKHWDRWYAGPNVVIAVVGDVSVVQNSKVKIQSLVEEYFTKGKPRSGDGKKDYARAKQQEPRVKVFYKDTEQAHFHLGFPGLSRVDERRYGLNLLVTILGGNSSSRMFNEIREKRGLAYYAYAGADTYQDQGSVYAFEGVALGQIEEAIKVTVGEFGRFAGDVSEEELERAKEFVVGKLALDLESSSTLANVVARKLLLEDELFDMNEVVRKTRAVDLDQVKDLARELFDMKRVNLAVVGPFKDEGRFEKLLRNK